MLYRAGAGVLPGALYPPTSPDGSQATALLGIELDHPVFRFVRGRPDPLPPSTIARYFPASRRPDAQRLAEYGSGDAFLIAGGSGRGRVLLVTVPLDADWSTLPLSNFYLPFVQSAVRFLASGAIAGRNLKAGDALVADLGAAPEGRSAALFPPDGSKIDLPVLRFNGRGEVRYAETDAPGRYRLVVSGGGAPEQTFHYVVPPPLAESDLTPLSEERWRELEQQLGIRRLDLQERSITDTIAGPRGGRELWAAVLGAVLVLALCELFIARAVARQAA
jgi:hypothetical protein